MSLPKSLLLKHSCMYTKRGGVAAYHIVWIGLCLRSVLGVRVLASAMDESSTALARTRVRVLVLTIEGVQSIYSFSCLTNSVFYFCCIIS